MKLETPYKMESTVGKTENNRSKMQGVIIIDSFQPTFPTLHLAWVGKSSIFLGKFLFLVRIITGPSEMKKQVQ